MNTTPKVTLKETTQLTQEKNQYLTNKISQVSFQENPKIKKVEKTQKNSKTLQFSSPKSLTTKNSQMLISSQVNSSEYVLNDLGISVKISKEKINQDKKTASALITNEKFANTSQQLNKSVRNVQNNQDSNEKNNLQLTKSSQLRKKNLSPFAKKNELTQQTSSLQFKPSKFVENLDINKSKMQTPTFNDIQASKKSIQVKPQTKGQRIKLRDYLFLAQVSSEVVANKKRIQRSNSKSGIIQSVPLDLKHCRSGQSLQLKRTSASKFLISNDEMASILTRQIKQEMLELKCKISKIETWLCEMPQGELNQIKPFYLARQGLKNVNATFQELLKKIQGSTLKIYKGDKVLEMKQSIALSKVVNPNIKMAEI